MGEFGDYLKKLRIRKGLSQAKVYQKTGITNSRLCKAENGTCDILTPLDLKKLAKLYEEPTVSVYIEAGYLNISDFEEYRSGFKNTGLLEPDEKKHIQDQIDFIVKKKGQEL